MIRIPQNQTIVIPPTHPTYLLYNAASNGDAKSVKEILDKHGLNWLKLFNNSSALHIAFMRKHYGIVDLILEAMHTASKYYNLTNLTGLNYFHIACTRKNELVIQGFLDSGVDVQTVTKENLTQWPGYNALHFAAAFQSLPAIKLLLNANVDPHIKTSSGRTALDITHQSSADSLIIADLLEDKILGVFPNRHFSNFQVACLNENQNLVQKFIDYGVAKINSTTSHELTIAPLSTPLHCAVASNCKEKVELLLHNGAKVECKNYKNMTPLHAALYGQSIVYENSGHHIQEIFNLKVVELLYAAIEDKMISHEDSNGLSFFHAAIATGDLSTVKKYVIEGKTDVNKCLSNSAGRFANYTPLHMAVHFDKLEIAIFLIERGAELNTSDKNYGTPLQMAFNFDHHNFIEFFMRKKVRLDIVTPKEQQTMLHLLVKLISHSFYLSSNKEWYNKLSKESIVMYMEQLFRLGIDVNAKDKEGNTALHLFYNESHHWATYFQMLLDLGADINLRNNKGQLPFDSTEWQTKQLKIKANAIFYHHVQKLKALGLEVDTENDETCLKIIKDGSCFENEELNCRVLQRLDEITKLQSIMIGDTTSLYNFIKLDPELAVLYAKCKNLKKVAEDEDLKKKFPSYGYLIQLKYRAATGFYGNSTKKRLHGDDDNNGNIICKRQRFE